MIETKAWLLPSDQHDSEASFVSHHPSVSFGSPEGFRGDFVFLARDTCLRREGRGYGRQAAPPYIDNPDASGLVATKPELREYKAVYVQSDAEIGLFSDEVVVNCAP